MKSSHGSPQVQSGGDSSIIFKPLKKYSSPLFDPRFPPVDSVPSDVFSLTRKKAPSTLLISSKEEKKSRGVYSKGVNNEEPNTKAHSGIQTPRRAATTSYVSPIFHFTLHDTTIIAMGHNNHYKLMAISTSRREIFVTLTQELPVIENMGAIKSFEDLLGSGGGLSGSGMPPPPFMTESLSKWDPIEMTVLVDQLRHPCTQLEWGPWQYGVYLAGLCPGWQIRMYRFSHSRWALDAALDVPNGVSISFSSQCILACACNSGEILLFVRQSDSSSDMSPWILCCRFSARPHENSIATFPQSPEKSAQDASLSSTRVDQPTLDVINAPILTTNTKIGDNVISLRCVCVSFDDTGSLLASGYQDGSIRVSLVLDGGSQIRNVFFSSDSTHRNDICRQVVWAPSSGRKFLILAIVYTNYFTIVLFQRPRLHSLSCRSTGLPSGAFGLFSSTHICSSSCDPSASDRGVAKSKQRAFRLLVLESVTSTCEGMSKLLWNTTGTRFVTSHADGLLHAWSVDISYVQGKQHQLTPLSSSDNDKNVVMHARMVLHSGKGYNAKDEAPYLSHNLQQKTLHVGAASYQSPLTHGEASFSEDEVHGVNALPEVPQIHTKELSLHVSLRKVSSAHPYHSIISK